MNESFRNTAQFDYYLTRKKHKKNITISIANDGSIKVSAPLHASLQELDALLLKKAAWIDKHLTEIKRRPAPSVNLYAASTVVPYLGAQYPVIFSATHTKSCQITLIDGAFHIKIPDNYTAEERTASIPRLFKHWYIQQGHTLLQEILPRFTNEIGQTPQKVVFKEQKRRWGSCSRKGNIYLNWRLMMAPLPIIEYVLVHELAHLIHFDHSKSFWSLVETIQPDYRQRLAWLKEHGTWLSNWQ